MERPLYTINDRPGAGKSKDLSMLLKFRSYIAPHKTQIFFAAFFLIASIVVDLLRPLVLRYAIDNAFPQKDIALIATMAGIYFALIVTGVLTSFIENFLLKKFGQVVVLAIRNDVFAKIISRNKARFESIPLGNLVTRITSDTEALRSLFTDVLLKMLTSLLLLVGILIFMFILSAKLALLTACIIPIMGYVIFVYRKYARTAFRSVRKKLAESNAFVQEALNFIVIVKTYLGEKTFNQRYAIISKEFLAAGLSEVRTFAVFRPIIDALYFIVVIAILSYTNWFDNALDAGIVFAAIQYVERIFDPLKDISDKYTILQQSLAGAERLIPILEEKEDISLGSVTVPKELTPIHSITFDHVWFSYDETENYVLKDVSFTVKGGEFVGIVGPSGAGKSTLMALLMCFVTPSKGRILINDTDIHSYPAQTIREMIGYVFQDSHLFKGSIRDNLCLYDTEISEDELVHATKKAHLHDMIMRLPKKYDTPVGYLGSLLSGGQKQLLSLARALVKNKPIMIFDEATANIDSETERLIQQSMEETRGVRTMFSIAHRLSTVREADQILYVYKGEIVEQGSFTDLLEAKGPFYKLWSTIDDTNSV